MASNAIHWKELAGSLLLLGIGACGSQQTAPPNVLLISLDSTRRDALGLYGYRSLGAPELSNTPHLEALAAGGVAMLDAYSTTSWTLPSHVAMLTGEPAVVHGVDMDHQLQDPSLQPLPLILKEAGYRTAGFFSAPYLEPHFGFSRGFDVYEPRYGDGVGAAALVAAGLRKERKGLEEEGAGQALTDVLAKEAAADEQHRELVRRTSSSVQVTAAAMGELEQ
ncbi:MAG: arylsulfatase A-like enzyme, partial [Candidatus Paceibacteria bacterium]